jgi:hypothetical protein
MQACIKGQRGRKTRFTQLILSGINCKKHHPLGQQVPKRKTIFSKNKLGYKTKELHYTLIRTKEVELVQ